MELTANGRRVDTAPGRFAPLEPASDLLGDPAGLREAMADRGYLFFPRLLDADTVLAARREILTKYAVLGEIDDRFPLDDAVAGDRTGVATANLRAFSESVRNGYWYRAVTDHEQLLGFYRDLLGGEVHCYDFRWPRFVRPGEGCGFHCDGPYMNRGTDRVFTSWIPLGRVRLEEGALMVLEGSHRSEELHAGYLRADADVDGLVWLDDDPVVVQQRYGRRWLSNDFAPGDVLCFGMHTLHGALDNHSPTGRCRLSSDSRYQRADEPVDHRWNGTEIEGHGDRRVFYPGLGQWNNEDFQDEWKRIDEHGRLLTTGLATGTAPRGRQEAHR
ncbi:MAG: phytanoyl-CoA dioxygenase family protein [Acidimicrobiales bacterium]|nr:phytanoyl-CoA dioxygenase family protein [Acidimicrobiales bacterium]